MMEPSNSRASRRRRRTPQPPAGRSRQNGSVPFPMSRSAEGQSGRYALPSAGESRLAPRGMVRSNGSIPAENPRFNLRYLLSSNSSSSYGDRSSMSPQRRRELPPRLQPRFQNNEGLGQVQPLRREGRSPQFGRPSPSVIQLPEPRQGRSLQPSPAPSPMRPRRMRKAVRRARRPASLWLQITRLLIIGVGIGSIAGTVLSAWDPASDNPNSSTQVAANTISAQQQNANQSISRDLAPGELTPLSAAIRLGQEMPSLTASIQSLAAQNAGLTPGVFLVDLDTGAYVNVNGTSTFAAASMIKVPILVAFLQDLDAGKVRLDEILTMRPEDIAEGSGDMQYLPAGTQFTTLEVATQMIQTSDNTATNMIIHRLGGAQALNQRFRTWGMNSTVIRNLLPDLSGTNTTSPKDLSDLLSRVVQGDLLSLRSRDRLLNIMQGTVTRTLLPAGLGEGAVIAHKTGNIDTLVGDTGIVDVPNGKRYIVTAMVQRPIDDSRAQELIRQISSTAYQFLNQPNPGANSATNLGTPGTTGVNGTNGAIAPQPSPVPNTSFSPTLPPGFNQAPIAPTFSPSPTLPQGTSIPPQGAIVP